VNKRLPCLALLAALGLAACDDLPTGAPGPGVQVSAGDVGPGPDAADPAVAGDLFARVCEASAPSFAEAPAILRGLPFAQRPATGTWYHRQLDLSIRINPGNPESCSLVAGTNVAEPFERFVEGAQAAGIRGVGAVTVESQFDPASGRTYVVARLLGQ
jgi:hypothetical protein